MSTFLGKLYVIFLHFCTVNGCIFWLKAILQKIGNIGYNFPDKIQNLTYFPRLSEYKLINGYYLILNSHHAAIQLYNNIIFCFFNFGVIKILLKASIIHTNIRWIIFTDSFYLRILPKYRKQKFKKKIGKKSQIGTKNGKNIYINRKTSNKCKPKIPFSRGEKRSLKQIIHLFSCVLLPSRLPSKLVLDDDASFLWSWHVFPDFAPNVEEIKCLNFSHLLGLKMIK